MSIPAARRCKNKKAATADHRSAIAASDFFSQPGFALSFSELDLFLGRLSQYWQAILDTKPLDLSEFQIGTEADESQPGRMQQRLRLAVGMSRRAIRHHSITLIPVVSRTHKNEYS
jgi:hypothetical protein